jgi:signal transduction histidine kinase
MPAGLRADWADLPCSMDGGPTGAAAAIRSTVIDEDVRAAASWKRHREVAEHAGIRSSWAVPVMSSGGLLGVITVFRRNRGVPHRDELDLVTLYAGYAASAAERDQLLGEVTARNRVLETIRVVLEELAVSVPLGDGLGVVVDTMRDGLAAEEVGVVGRRAGGQVWCRAWSDGADNAYESRPELLAAVDAAAATTFGSERTICVNGADCVVLAAPIPVVDGPLALVATWPADAPPGESAFALLDDAARSIQLALERETSERANRETVALRRSQELQRAFLSRLSHELRTPLTAIHGYADSLLQPDVDWDAESKNRFLSRIASESARLGRLVGDLLDLSAIESNILRLHRDWCDLALILDAARDCLPLSAIDRVSLDCTDLAPVWADHDRLEQVLVNLMDNAIRHNPPTTRVTAAAHGGASSVTITVTDDGIGLADDSPDPRIEAQRRSTAGAGLGLSIARAIVAAHGGSLSLDTSERGTCWRIDLPIDGGDPDFEPAVAAAVDG